MLDSTMDREFTKNFLISCGAHVLLVAFAFLGGQLVMSVFKSNNDVEIIRSAVRVDVVGMPKFTVQELKAMQEAERKAEAVEVQGKKEETKTETEDVIKKDDLVIQEEGKSKSKTSFMNLISDYSSKKVAKKENKKGEKAGSTQKLDSLILEGNRLSKGSALVGEYTDQENSEFAAYVQSLPDLIRNFWKLPSYLKDQGLKCRVRIFLSQSGEILKLEIHESSGQSEFDARAEKAVREAAPFPAASDKVAARLTNSGIILGFPI